MKKSKNEIRLRRKKKQRANKYKLRFLFVVLFVASLCNMITMQAHEKKSLFFSIHKKKEL
jgi:hypothetical protein